ncbi:MAG: hypothetical protein Q8P18_19355 [Pseudomonadota bacterium]|nr:hypothetical protein [Pseudomonadota bacterium]
MRTLPLLVLFACTGEKDEPTPTPPPLGMTLAEDGQVYAGIARVDITPTDFETYTDLDGDHSFDGCMTDPAASRTGCEEPFDDLNGNGRFDAVWIAGFGSARAAQGAHDPITVTAVVLSLDGEYVALVGVDALGVLENRIRDTRDMLQADGFDRDRIVISSSHTHQGPDTAGIYGIDEDLVTGIYPPFVESIPEAIYDAVATASAGMVAVTPSQGAVFMSDLDPAFNGEPFGGTNPDPSVDGGINDIRDPVIVADQVLSIALDGADGRVATIVNASGHPEVVGDENSELSADYVGYTRSYLEERHGGLTVFLSGALGGMQSSLGATLPAIDEQGARVLDADGNPTWLDDSAPGADWEFARTWGTLVAQASEAALTDTTPWTSLRVRHSDFLIPVDNPSFKLAFQVGLLDTPDDYVIQDSSCPGFGEDNDLFGCIPSASWVIELGPVTFGTAPGELMPELFWGVPDEPAMVDPTLRPSDRRWVQADSDCVGVPYEDCQDTDGMVGECDCLKHHAVPYRITDDAALGTIESMLPGTFKAPIGIANAYCGYIVPAPDYNTYVSVLTDDGDHYEETNSCSGSFGPLVLGAFAAMRE